MGTENPNITETAVLAVAERALADMKALKHSEAVLPYVTDWGLHKIPRLGHESLIIDPETGETGALTGLTKVPEFEHPRKVACRVIEVPIDTEPPGGW